MKNIESRTPCPAERQYGEGIDIFLSNVAAAGTLLAGGSAAALAGALAAALGEMMAGLTEGREKFASVQFQVLETHAKLTRLRKTLRSLIEEDSIAFNSLMSAIKLPQKNEGQRAARAVAIEESAKGATETPLRTARAAFEVLENLCYLAAAGNPHAVCDVAAGAQLAYATLKGGQYNVLANIRNMKDMAFVESCRSEISDLLLRGEKILHQIDCLVSRP